MVTLAVQEALRQHANLSNIIEKYPSQAGSLTQTLTDLTYASKWEHLSVIDTLPDGKGEGHDVQSDQLGRAIIVGLRPEASGLEAVWCCSISDMLNSAIFQHIFTFLDTLGLSVQSKGKDSPPLLRTHFLIAVHSPDATVVYYNMARGLVKPVN